MLYSSWKEIKKVDIIHAQWAFSALPAVLLKKIYKKPVILTERGAAMNLLMKHKLTKKISFISTGGGASLTVLSGESLPAIVALEKSAKKFKKYFSLS